MAREESEKQSGILSDLTVALLVLTVLIVSLTLILVILTIIELSIVELSIVEISEVARGMIIVLAVLVSFFATYMLCHFGKRHLQQPNVWKPQKRTP